MVTDSPTPDVFPGFDIPRENWFKLPNSMIGFFAESSLAETRVLMYVLRHTWGYQEFEAAKRITLDEFMRGRKNGDGSRMDAGTALSKQSVLTGIRGCVERGLLVVETNGSDPARIKKYYRLHMRGSEDTAENPMSKNETSGVKNLTPDPPNEGPKTIPPMSKNETPRMSKILTPYRERNLRKTIQSPTGDGQPENPGGFFVDTKTPAATASKFAVTATKKLYQALAAKNQIMARPNLGQWAKQIDKFLAKCDGEKPHVRFREVLKWFCKNFTAKKYVPHARSAKGFCDKFDDIAAAMMRNSWDENGTPDEPGTTGGWITPGLSRDLVSAFRSKDRRYDHTPIIPPEEIEAFRPEWEAAGRPAQMPGYETNPAEAELVDENGYSLD